MKLDLLTNATVVDDAIRFVSESEKSKDKVKEQVKNSWATRNLRSLIMIMMMKSPIKKVKRGERCCSSRHYTAKRTYFFYQQKTSSK
jgi:hypothetical protein